jgi:hypothetical protein
MGILPGMPGHAAGLIKVPVGAYYLDVQGAAFFLKFYSP